MTTRRGLLIGIFGPDGTGKSTLASGLSARLSEGNVRARRTHWRPGILPYRPQHSPTGGPDPHSEPHATRVRVGLPAALIVAYIAMDFLLGHVFVNKRRLRQGQFIISERYYHDLVIDPRRYGIELPSWAERVVAMLVPSPDIVVVLDAPADVIRSRKAELSREEIERQRLLLRSLFSKAKKKILLDVEKLSPEATVDQVYRFLT